MGLLTAAIHPLWSVHGSRILVHPFERHRLAVCHWTSRRSSTSCLGSFVPKWTFRNVSRSGGRKTGSSYLSVLFIFFFSSFHRYPLAMAAHGRLQVLRASSPEEIDGGEQALLGAVEVSRKFFRNAFLLPYSFLFDHLLSTETNRVSALLPAFLASDVVKQYRYVVSLDKHLNDGQGKRKSALKFIIFFCKNRSE